jgi:PAS domain S-box-containing protein
VATTRIAKIVAWFSFVPALVGAVAMLGWVIGNPLLKSVIPGLIAMNPLTAICFAVAAGSLWLQRTVEVPIWHVRLAQVAATAVAIVGGLKISSYAFGFDVPIDRLLFADALGDNRMAPNTALCFLLCGIALAILDYVTKRGFWPAQIPALLVVTISLVSLVGYGYGAESLYQMASYVPMALNTATAFGVLAIGTLLSRPDRGIVSVVLEPGVGGIMARRLLPAVIIIPCGLGWLRIIGERQGFYDTEFGAAMMVAVTVMLFTAAVGWIAAALNRSDADRCRAMKELQRSNVEIYDLYNCAPCGYHSLNENGTIIAMNDTELTWLGYDRRDVVGKMSFVELLTKAGEATFAVNFLKFKREGRAQDLEFELERKDGSTFPVIINATAIYDEDGKYLASRSTVFDATERKRAEDAIRRFNEELEQRVVDRTRELAAANADLLQKNEENEMFVYSVSHDLRSPLVNLQGFSQEISMALPALRELIAGGNLAPEEMQRGTKLIDADMQQSVHFIQSAVSRLGGIIDALLRLSRAGRVEYRYEAVDANRLVERIVEAMSSTIYDRGAQIDIQPLPKCFGDPTALEQVFANLICNAVNYLSPERPGQIEVGSLPAEMSVESGQAATVYFVKDNGLGIDKAYHKKVFQALKRLHPDAARGEGIGLTVVKRIVERHGGAIWFESSAGAGTTFFVTLPNSAPTASRSEVRVLPLEGVIEHEHRSFGTTVSGRR